MGVLSMYLCINRISSWKPENNGLLIFYSVSEQTGMHVCVICFLYMHLCTQTYTERERERKGGRDRERVTHTHTLSLSL